MIKGFKTVIYVLTINTVKGSKDIKKVLIVLIVINSVLTVMVFNNVITAIASVLLCRLVWVEVLLLPKPKM